MIAMHSPITTRKSSCTDSAWYMPAGRPGRRTRMAKPAPGFAYSLRSGRPRRTNSSDSKMAHASVASLFIQAASPALTTNHPAVTGARPDSTGSSRASSTTGTSHIAVAAVTLAPGETTTRRGAERGAARGACDLGWTRGRQGRLGGGALGRQRGEDHEDQGHSRTQPQRACRRGLLAQRGLCQRATGPGVRGHGPPRAPAGHGPERALWLDRLLPRCPRPVQVEPDLSGGDRAAAGRSIAALRGRSPDV